MKLALQNGLSLARDDWLSRTHHREVNVPDLLFQCLRLQKPASRSNGQSVNNHHSPQRCNYSRSSSFIDRHSPDRPLARASRINVFNRLCC